MSEELRCRQGFSIAKGQVFSDVVYDVDDFGVLVE